MLQVDVRPGSNAPNPLLIAVAFGTSLGCCPDAGWVASSASLLRFGLLSAFTTGTSFFWDNLLVISIGKGFGALKGLIVGLRFCVRYGGDDDGI